MAVRVTGRGTRTLTIADRNAVVIGEVVEGANGQPHMVPPLRPRSRAPDSERWSPGREIGARFRTDLGASHEKSVDAVLLSW